MTTIDYAFEELSPRDESGRQIPGMILYGKATLGTDDADFDKYAFEVTRIELDGGYRLSKVGSTKWLWDKIQFELYNQKTHIGRDAHEAFRAAVDGAEPAKPFIGKVYSALENRT